MGVTPTYRWGFELLSVLRFKRFCRNPGFWSAGASSRFQKRRQAAALQISYFKVQDAVSPKPSKPPAPGRTAKSEGSVDPMPGSSGSSTAGVLRSCT